MSAVEKEIFLIRHGETEYNRMGYVQGSGIDSSLNDTGRHQAHTFFEMYGQLPFDKVYTSKLQRTHQSVAAFIEKGLPWEQHAGLNEISWGQSEGQPPTPESNKAYFSTVDAWRRGYTNVATPGGESPDQVAARQKVWAQLMMSRPEERLILVCMHGRAMRIMLCHLLGLPLSAQDQFEHRNLCLYRLHYSGQQFSIVERNIITY
jgi:broad specificity phosphatase PhoE